MLRRNISLGKQTWTGPLDKIQNYLHFSLCLFYSLIHAEYLNMRYINHFSRQSYFWNKFVMYASHVMSF